MKIMVVDDQWKNLGYLASGGAQNNNLSFSCYQNPLVALEALAAGSWDALLTDLFFPAECYESKSYKYELLLLGEVSLGGETPLGLVLAIKALMLNIRTLVYSATNHHSDMLAGFLSLLNLGKPEKLFSFISMREAYCISEKDTFMQREEEKISALECGRRGFDSDLEGWIHESFTRGKPIPEWIPIRKDWERAMKVSGIFPEMA